MLRIIRKVKQALAYVRAQQEMERYQDARNQARIEARIAISEGCR